jgi:hypothetical protein
MLLIALGALLLYKGVITKSQFDMLKSLVVVTVQGAEQIFGSGVGEEKKKYVLEKLQQYGIDINKIEIDLLIESAVLQMNTWMKQQRSALVQTETNLQ